MGRNIEQVTSEEKKMRKFTKSDEAIQKLSPEQYRVTQQNETERPGTGEYSRSQGTGYLCRYCVGRAPIRFVRQIRIGMRLA